MFGVRRTFTDLKYGLAAKTGLYNGIFDPSSLNYLEMSFLELEKS
jgi:hypothetical protein